MEQKLNSHKAPRRPDETSLGSEEWHKKERLDVFGAPATLNSMARLPGDVRKRRPERPTLPGRDPAPAETRSGKWKFVTHTQGADRPGCIGHRGIEYDLADIEQTKIDLTPSPAISSFIWYTGDEFPNWRNNVIVGSLKATELYRIVVEDNQVKHMETLIKNFARIRDVERGADDYIYLLLEHGEGGGRSCDWFPIPRGLSVPRDAIAGNWEVHR